LHVKAVENPNNSLSDSPLFVTLLPVEQGVITVALWHDVAYQLHGFGLPPVAGLDGYRPTHIIGRY